MVFVATLVVVLKRKDMTSALNTVHNRLSFGGLPNIIIPYIYLVGRREGERAWTLGLGLGLGLRLGLGLDLG